MYISVVLYEQNILFLAKLKLTITRGQGNLSTAFIFVSCEEKAYCHVVSVGQLSFG